MSSDRLRLFVAASVPPEQLDLLGRRTEELRDRWSGARWAPVANQHVTLKFLGGVPADLLGTICEVCDAVAAEVEPATLRLDGLGAFPSSRRARVLWVGVEDPSGVLAAVAGGLDRALSPLGFAAEKRPYTAHLTLARFKVPQALAPLPALEAFEPFRLGRFDLWRSHLSPKGARYERIQGFDLGTAGHST